MLFGHWFPPYDTSLAGCKSDIVTVGYRLFVFFSNVFILNRLKILKNILKVLVELSIKWLDY